MEMHTSPGLEPEKRYPLFIFEPDLIESLNALYKPPPRPRSKAEALFFLSSGGRDYLHGLPYLLDVHIAVLNNPALLADGEIAVSNSFILQNDGKTPSYQPVHALDLTTYFSGFGALGEWISETWALAFDGCQPQSNKGSRCVDRDWMKSFSTNIDAQKYTTFIEQLREGIRYIIDVADRNWFVNVYGALIVEYLKDAADTNDREYANDPLLRDTNSKIDREALYISLKEAGIFRVHFNCYNSMKEDETDFLDESYYQPRIDLLTNMLLSKEAMSIREVYEDFIASLPLPICESAGESVTVISPPWPNVVPSRIDASCNPTHQENILPVIPTDSLEQDGKTHDASTNNMGTPEERSSQVEMKAAQVPKDNISKEDVLVQPRALKTSAETPEFESAVITGHQPVVLPPTLESLEMLHKKYKFGWKPLYHFVLITQCVPPGTKQTDIISRTDFPEELKGSSTAPSRHSIKSRMTRIYTALKRIEGIKFDGYCLVNKPPELWDIILKMKDKGKRRTE